MKKRFAITLITALLLVFTLSSCGPDYKGMYEDRVQRVDELTQENQELKQEVDSLKQERNKLLGYANSSSDQFLSTVFWSDGNTYVVGNCKFYSDAYCSQQVTKNLLFTSSVSLDIELANGNDVYCSFSNEGIVWSVDRPRFKEVTSE